MAKKKASKKKNQKAEENLTQEELMTKALTQKSSDFRSWMSYGRLPESLTIIDAPCPRCGAQVICAYADMGGGVDYYDTFAHVCLNLQCDYVKSETFFDSSGSLPANSCPFPHQ